ncbi:hypothetical protein B0T16DRAFT_490511 [Cercophora newfieldiana]|uniref:Mid2 domain-containing protein n=1 Tax=Cercophora newfieldiana TaxID=92897 RepID=A0AA39YHH2_9PEZI|nr:hypothetical protein B0T16DRAFT_490511 [Cercophora newfieldiana]
MLAALLGRVVPLGLVFLSVLTTLCLADEFTTPPLSGGDLQQHFKIGEKLAITWVASVKKVTLDIRRWAEHEAGETVGVLAIAIANSGSFYWTVGEFDNINSQTLAKSSQFCFVITDPNRTINETTSEDGWVKGKLQSRAFIIDDVDSSSTTTTSSTPTQTLSVAATVTAVADGGLTQSAKIGIGVGVGVGVVVLVILASLVTVVFMHRRQQQATVPCYEVAVPASPPLEQTYKPLALDWRHRVELGGEDH